MGRKRRHEELEPVVVSSDEVESLDEDDKQQSQRKSERITETENGGPKAWRYEGRAVHWNIF